MSVIRIERKVLERNDAAAQENRAFFRERGLFVVNLLSSPGSGKTSLLEQTLPRLKEKIGVAVIEGDVQTDLDAQRLEALEVPVAQIITQGGCHLDAKMVQKALETLPLSGVKLLFIENVGNLVCPAGFDLGESLKAVIISVTEGEEKPLKYPAVFRNASVCIINKADLLPFLNIGMERLRSNVLSINRRLTLFTTSCISGEGLDEWCAWLLQQTETV